MKKVLFLLLAAGLFSSHDMFLKLDTYFLPPDSATIVQLYNGTFEESSNVIARDRMEDVSVVAAGRRTRLDTTQWSERDSTTLLQLQTGAPGTYVVSVSTRARSIALAADDFNGYLEHDGILDMLQSRTENNTLDQDAVELYSKHVKSIFQVGEESSTDWQTVLGYPLEFVPLENPYDLHAGHDLGIRLLRDGQPLADQLVYVGTPGDSHSHSHDGGKTHTHTASTTQHRTDADGTLTMELPTEGEYYLRTIQLVESTDPELTHESNWATLTFAVGGSDHSHGEGDHAHTHESGGLPTSVVILGSLALLGGLFFFFNRKA